MSSNMGWMRDRACADLDTYDIEVHFFPHPNSDAADTKRTYCRPCPVVNECLKYALDNRIEFGVWGGATEQERAAMLRGSRQPQRPNPPTVHKRCGSYSGVSRHRKLDEALCADCRVAKSDYERGRRAEAKEPA